MLLIIFSSNFFDYNVYIVPTIRIIKSYEKVPIRLAKRCSCEQNTSKIVLTLARTGEVGATPPPPWGFSQSAAGFWGTLWGKPCATFGTGCLRKVSEFENCIFRVVLRIECRIGHQVKACSKIFCLSEDPPHGVTWLRRAGHVFVMTHFSLEE